MSTDLTWLYKSKLAASIAQNPDVYDAAILSQITWKQFNVYSYNRLFINGFNAVASEILGNLRVGKDLRTAIRQDLFPPKSFQQVRDSSSSSSRLQREDFKKLRKLISVSNYGQNTKDEELQKYIPKSVAKAFGVPENTTKLAFIKGVIERYKTESLFVLVLLTIGALFIISPGILGTLVPYLVGRASRSAIKTLLLEKYPLKNETNRTKKLIAIGLRVALLGGLAATSFGLQKAADLANNIAQSWRGSGPLGVAQAAAEMSVNTIASGLSYVPGGFLGKLTSMDVTADVSVEAGAALTEQAATFTFWTGKSISELPSIVVQGLGLVAKTLTYLPWETSGAKYARAAEEVMKKTNVLYPKSLVNAITARGTYKGYERIKDFYETQNILLLSQSAFSMLLMHGVDPVRFGKWLRSAYESMLGGIKEEYRESKEKIENLGKKVLENPIYRTGAFFILSLITDTIAGAFFGQDKKAKKKKPSKFNKRVGAELKKYRTKAASREEHQQRLARCSRRVAKQMKAEKKKK